MNLGDRELELQSLKAIVREIIHKDLDIPNSQNIKSL